jgi:hypothetical protein
MVALGIWAAPVAAMAAWMLSALRSTECDPHSNCYTDVYIGFPGAFLAAVVWLWVSLRLAAAIVRRWDGRQHRGRSADQ